ncbi:MAG TPA: hypothetical protein VLJ17_24520 [Xanthobacteraceae bacterium]|nr:hypothetical protein [Xanthobacteraceae bacterium]
MVAELTQDVFERINAERRRNGMAPLERQEALCLARRKRLEYTDEQWEESGTHFLFSYLTVVPLPN